MREFTATELDILRQLLAASSDPPGRIERFLEQVFFSEAQARALILQPAGRFGYFYLQRAVHDDAPARAEQVRQLIELLMLVKYLRESGFIVINGDAKSGDRQMRFVGGLIRNPVPSTAHIVLNERGDYTFRPETICERGDNVIYKGVRLESDLYDLAAANASGLMYISPTVKALIPTPREPRRSRLRAPGWRPAYAAAVLVVALLLYRASGVEIQISRTRSAEPPAAQSQETVKDVGIAPASLSEPAAAPPPALSVNNERTEYYGVDLSKWNAGELESALDAGSIDFVFVRASSGRTKDTGYDRNWTRLQQRGVIRGAYHFYLVHEDAIEQADFFLSVAGDAEPLEIAPAVDFEEQSFQAGVTAPDVAAVQSGLLAALARIEQRTQRVPIIYTNVSMGNRYLADARFARYPLWIADWTNRAEPTVPEAWKDTGYRFWQRTSQYTLPGSDGEGVDYDLFKGRRIDIYR